MIEKLMKFYKERESFKVKEASSKKKSKRKMMRTMNYLLFLRKNMTSNNFE